MFNTDSWLVGVRDEVSRCAMDWRWKNIQHIRRGVAGGDSINASSDYHERETNQLLNDQR
ncbi:MAG: hypothetical protein ACD_16C00203G0007 [uncultured bacterium]|nr:MAG: hypothetical protein ACD_16C00203G0007 [uncultured bacterium]